MEPDSRQMTNLEFKGKGCFPFHFRHPEIFSPFFDTLGFNQGFKRSHGSGLTFYIHRTKNKKEVAPFGLTIPLLTNNVNELKEIFQKIPNTTIEAKQWFGSDAFIVTLADQKKFLLLKENQLLPSNINYTGKQSQNALSGDGYLILNTKNPEKAAIWYEAFLECETVFKSDQICVSIMTNFNESNPNLIIFHQLEKDSKNIGPIHYKNFCLTTKNIYACWNYLASKGKINPRWKNPTEDGIYRTLLISAPDGYEWKIYGEIPVYTLSQAAKILKRPKDQLLLAIQNGHLQILKKKNSPTEVEEEPSVCEDHLLQYFWKKSPYREELTFPK
jgi:hypothetical protein